jgi:hypothetical protein
MADHARGIKRRIRAPGERPGGHIKIEGKAHPISLGAIDAHSVLVVSQ